MQKKTRMATSSFNEAISIRVCTKPTWITPSPGLRADQRFVGWEGRRLPRDPNVVRIAGALGRLGSLDNRLQFCAERTLKLMNTEKV